MIAVTINAARGLASKHPPKWSPPHEESKIETVYHPRNT